jgi:hypothetical protein
MTSTLTLPVDCIRDRLNADPEFKLAARFWYCDLRFKVGEELYFMRVENGRVAELQPRHAWFRPLHHQHRRGPVEVWEQMLADKPKPFFHDWFAASFHHPFEFGGDLESAYAYYYALRRIHAIMGECCARTERKAA